MVYGVAHRQASVVGGDGSERSQAALQAALIEMACHLERLACRAVEKRIRRIVFEGLPTLRSIRDQHPVNIRIDTSAIVREEVADLRAAASAGSWETIVARCPVRETPALDTLARGIGLSNRHQYEQAVIRMLQDDSSVLQTAQSLFGGLADRLRTAQA